MVISCCATSTIWLYLSNDSDFYKRDISRMTPNAEKPPDEQRSTPTGLQDKIEPLSYDSQSPKKANDQNLSQKAEDTTTEEKDQGSIRDYFVSTAHMRPSKLQSTYTIKANLSICGSSRLALVLNRIRWCYSVWRCSAIDDVGLRLINDLLQQLRRRAGRLAAVPEQY